MMTEERVITEDPKNVLVPYGAEQSLVTAHCKWCAGQGLSESDDDIFDLHFKTIVEAMRRHEGKKHSGAKSSVTPLRDAGSALPDRQDFDQDMADSDFAKLPALNVGNFTRWGLAQSLLALVVVAVVCTNFIGAKPVDRSVFGGLSGGVYSTSTGSIKVALKDEIATINGIGTQYRLPIVIWRGGWQDEFALLQGKFDRCNWLQVAGENLVAVDGMVLYNSNAPEIRTVASMRQFRDRVCKYYQAFGRYPNEASDLAQDDSYINAVNKQRTNYDIHQVINGAIVSGGSGTSSAANDRRCGSIASRAGVKVPGALWAVGVKSEPIIAADNNSYNFHNNSFYIYGADSKGDPVKGGIGSKDFTIALKNGQDISEIQNSILSGGVSKVGFYSGNMPEINGIRWRYSFLGFTLVLLLAMTIVRLMHTKVGDDQLKRLRKGRK
jgi:hypothetical protein